MRREQLREGAAVEQGDVARGDDDGPLEVAVAGGVERGERASDGAPGPGDLVLVRDDRRRDQLGHVGRHLVALVPDDDDDAVRVEVTGCGEGVPHEGPPADRVEHLGDRGPHPRTLTRGKDDDGCGAG